MLLCQRVNLCRQLDFGGQVSGLRNRWDVLGCPGPVSDQTWLAKHGRFTSKFGIKLGHLIEKYRKMISKWDLPQVIAMAFLGE